jgi:hypothetical protein
MLYVKLLVLLYLQNMHILYLAIYHIQYTYIHYMSEETVLKTCIHMTMDSFQSPYISLPYIKSASRSRLLYKRKLFTLILYDENKGKAV